ncbi:MAG: hypothetical protein Q9188_002838 [Gyalolechia gomerana]
MGVFSTPRCLLLATVERVQKLAHTSDSLSKTSNLTVEHRQLAFQHWVAYDLYSEKNRRTTGQIQCPLIGCRSGFDDLESCLAHLAKCTWLSNAWYWCPFCVRPEQFTARDQSLASALEPGQSGGEQKPSPLVHHQDSKPKSGAARFLKTVGGKLGCLQRTSMSRAFTRTHVSHSVRNQPQASQVLTGASNTVADKRTSFVVEKVASPRQDHVGASVATVCGPGYSPGYSVPELEGSSRQPEEMLGYPCTNMWYLPPAELPDCDYARHLPQELVGSTTSDLNTSHQWPSYKRWSSNYDRSPGSPLYSVDPPASVASLRSYTLQGPQHAAFSVESLQNRSELETMPDMSCRDSLPKSAGFQNTATPDPSMPHRVHVAQQPYCQEIHDPLRVSSHSSADRYQTSSMNEIRDVHSKVGSRRIQTPTSPSTQPQSTSFNGQPGSPYMMHPKHRALLSKTTTVDTIPLTSGQPQKHLFFAQRAMDASSLNGPTWDGQQQTFHPSLRESDPSSRTQGVQDQATSDSPAPFRSASSQETAAPLTSPTDSTVSNSRNSYRLSGASNTTQPTSAEATPIAPRTQPNLSMIVKTQPTKPQETSQCPHCPTVFTGTFQDRRSNRKRHIKYQHGPQEKFKCQGCKKEYSRPDNLLKHDQAKHQHVQQLKRNNARRIKRNL